MVDFLKRHQAKITSVILAVYCLPLLFQITPNAGIDGCWQRAVNLAVKNGLVFGTDFVFTYGPLGYLSTRNGQYIHSIVLLAGDLLLFLGYYYFLYKQISGDKKWFFLVLASLLLLRNSYYAQNLFLIFIFFIVLNIQSKFRNYFELVFCAASGTLLFFIKLNYGVVSFAALFLIALSLLATNRRSLVIFLLSGGLTFLVIYSNVHLDIPGYLKYGIELIRNYDQAMYVDARNSPTAFNSAIGLITVVVVLIAAYAVSRFRTKTVKPDNVVITLVLCATCFLLYKNGFTRTDFIHYNDFFSIFPFFIVGVIMVLGYGEKFISKVVVVLALVISVYILLKPAVDEKRIHVSDGISYLIPVDYLNGIFNKPKELDLPVLVLDNDKMKLIGQSTIDIMPLQISLLQYNNLNYDPRPIPQSYSAYSPALDSLNAQHFYNPRRPEFVLLQSNSIDGRYEIWDESITKAVMHLNYKYLDFLSIVKNDSLESNSGMSYLLLHSTAGSHTYPRFEKIREEIVNMGDKAAINFADTAVIYMTAEVSYTFRGRMRRLSYQPPQLNVTLSSDDGTSNSYKAVCSLLRQPVLINKAINNMVDLKNFFTGDLKKNRNITAIAFRAGTNGFEQKIKLSFFKFSNY